MSAKPESGWPEVQLNMLDNLWKAGKTAAQIAIELSRFGPPRPKAQRQAGMYDGRSVAERRMDSITGHARRLAAPPAVIRAPMADVPFSRFRTCQWPEGDVKAEGFRFCGAGTVPGKPYCAEHCAEHCAKAYVPREPRGGAR